MSAPRTCLLASALALSGCGATVPTPSDVRRTSASPWVARRVGCLDVGVAAARDPVAPPGSYVFAFEFVNGCGAAQPVDFTHLAAHALLADGRIVSLPVLDPARELHVASMAPGRDGAEALEFDPPAGHGAMPLPDVRRVCLDVSGLSGPAAPSPEVCFRASGAGLAPVESGMDWPAGEPSDLPGREVSLTVGHRHFSRFGDGWETLPALRSARGRSDFDVARWQSGGFPASYRVGSLIAGGDTPSSGARRAGCIDVRVEAVASPVAASTVVLAYMLGNRCPHGVAVALREAHVRASWASGAGRSLALYDPAAEVHAPVLGGLGDGTELLQYLLPADAPTGPAKVVCVDVSRIAGGATADVAPICLSRADRFANEDTVVGHEAFDPEAWRQPSAFFHLFYETGLAVNYLDPGVVAPALVPWETRTPAGRRFAVSPSAFKKTATYAWDLRYAWFSGPFYAGAALQIGAGALDANSRVAVDGVASRTDDYLGDLSIAGLGGRLWTSSTRVRLRTDVAVGARVIVAGLYPPGCTMSQCQWTAVAAWPAVTPRVVLDRWLSPRWSLGAWVSADVLHLPDFGVGLAIAWHPWAYDGLP